MSDTPKNAILGSKIVTICHEPFLPYSARALPGASVPGVRSPFPPQPAPSARQAVNQCPQAFDALRLCLGGEYPAHPARLVRVRRAFLCTLPCQMGQRAASVAAETGGVSQRLKVHAAMFAGFARVHAAIVSGFPTGNKPFLALLALYIVP